MLFRSQRRSTAYPRGLSATYNRLRLWLDLRPSVRIYETTGSFITTIGWKRMEMRGQFDEPMSPSTDGTFSPTGNNRMVFDATHTTRSAFGNQYFNQQVPVTRMATTMPGRHGEPHPVTKMPMPSALSYLGSAEGHGNLGNGLRANGQDLCCGAE